MWLCTKQCQTPWPAPALHVGVATIQPTSGARSLGVNFDNHIDLKRVDRATMERKCDTFFCCSH